MKANRILSSVFDEIDQPLMMAEIQGLIAKQRQFAVSFDRNGIATLAAPPEQVEQPAPSVA